MRDAPRLFVRGDLSEGRLVALDENQSAYLSRVMRLGLGDAARLFNGRDGEWLGTIDSVDRRAVSLRIEALHRPQPQSVTTAPHLLMAVIRRERLEMVVEKASELGCAQLTPVLTARSQARNLRIDRLQRIATEAAEQCERMDLMAVDEPLSLEQALDGIPPNRALFFCDEAGVAASFAHAATAAPASPACILVGPEGGFSEFERGALRGRDGTVPVSLGPRILRAETAAIAALVIWQAMAGDGGKAPRPGTVDPTTK